MRQLNDFSNMKLSNKLDGKMYPTDNKMYPTDIDGFIEYKNKLRIFIEIKYRKTILPTGQKLALERICCDMEVAGKKSIVLIAEHTQDDANINIDVSVCQVREYYFGGKWKPAIKPANLLEAVNGFICNNN